MFRLIYGNFYYFYLRVFAGTRMSTHNLLNLDLDPQVTRVTGHSELTDLKLADLPTSKLIGSRELLGVVASPSRDEVESSYIRKNTLACYLHYVSYFSAILSISAIFQLF